MKYLKLMRIKQWIKNVLIFIPGFFAGVFFEKEMLLKEVFSFLIFSLGASVVYILNDIHDVEKDRLHESKKYRPIASGEISIQKGYVLSCVLLIMCVVSNLALFGVSLETITVLGVYIGLNVLYSIGGAKNIPLLDVVILVSGFALRLIYGGLVAEVEISSWLFLVVISGAFYMGFGKRRNEMVRNKSKTRDVLRRYNREFLDKSMHCCMTLVITFYSLWCLDKCGGALSTNYLISIPLLLVILFKYSMNIEGNSDGDPTNVIFQDKILLLLCGVFGCLLLITIY